MALFLRILRSPLSIRCCYFGGGQMLPIIKFTVAPCNPLLRVANLPQEEGPLSSPHRLFTPQPQQTTEETTDIATGNPVLVQVISTPPQ